MLPKQLVIDHTIELIKKTIVTECPFITQQNCGENKGTIILHYTPRHDLPRVETVTSIQPRYDKGRVFLDFVKNEIDEDNLAWQLDLMETILQRGRMNSGSINFYFSGGCIFDIETKSTKLASDY
ncbi:hypothetical protein [Paenibacillus sp. GP183]|jgi:hypothetical protein|uniref:hypothetical protein n=1 Tax=Paenibacillus sp. GP183 TaxID=1882751 RepID=UPI000894256C|nr:hypothetical protein [Paenibacillus sp. GP183]SED10233.1 hypothetical protein SAMN05443246_5717 [Paenibacillus sp. GP183]